MLPPPPCALLLLLPPPPPPLHTGIVNNELLTVLRLASNRLVGDLPFAWGEYLVDVDLADNGFTGSECRGEGGGGGRGRGAALTLPRLLLINTPSLPCPGVPVAPDPDHPPYHPRPPSPSSAPVTIPLPHPAAYTKLWYQPSLIRLNLANNNLSLHMEVGGGREGCRYQPKLKRTRCNRARRAWPSRQRIAAVMCVCVYRMWWMSRHAGRAARTVGAAAGHAHRRSSHERLPLSRPTCASLQPHDNASSPPVTRQAVATPPMLLDC